jgi:hypothetical protein
MTVRQWAGRFQEAVEARPGLGLRLAVLAALLLALVFVVPAAAMGELAAWLLMGSPLILVALAALVRWPGLVFPLAIVCGLLVPFSLATGSQTAINASVVLLMTALGLWALDIAVGRSELRLDTAPMFLPLLALIGVSLLSLGFGQLPWFAARPAPLTAQLGGLAIIILSAGAFLFAALRLEDLRPLRWMVYLFLGLGGVFVFAALVPSIRPLAIAFYQRAVRDAMFWTWLVSLGLGQALLNRDLPCLADCLRRRRARRLLLHDHRSSVVGFRVASGPGGDRHHLGDAAPEVAAGGGAMGLLAAVLAPTWFQNVLLGGDNAYSLETRLAAWRSCCGLPASTRSWDWVRRTTTTTRPSSRFLAMRSASTPTTTTSICSSRSV